MGFVREECHMAVLLDTPPPSIRNVTHFFRLFEAPEALFIKVHLPVREETSVLKIRILF